MIETKVKKCWVKYVPPAPPLVGFEVNREDLDLFRNVLGEDLTGYTLTLKKKRKKSRDMHNYMWVLCDKIAEKTNTTKEDVYRHAVREAGVWNDGTFDNIDAEAVINGWSKNGIGWFAETVFQSRFTSTIRLYRGASVYDANQLYKLTNYVVESAKELGIDTATKDELLHLKMLWGGDANG